MAGEAWQYQQRNKNIYLPSYSGFKGMQGLKYALLSDLNCIFKNELIGYEWRLKFFNKKKPEIVRNSYERLDAQMQKSINELSEMMENPDRNIKELCIFYKKYIDVGAVFPDFA